MDDSAIALFNNTENTIFYGFLSFAGIIPIHNFGHVSQSQYEWKIFFFTVFLDRAYGSGPLGRRSAMTSERRVHPNQKLRKREDPNGLTTKQTGPSHPPPPLIHHPIPPLIVGDANLGSVIAAVGATIAGKERIAGTVVRSAIGVEDAFVRLAVELLVAEEAKLPRCRPLDVRLVYVQHGYSFRRRNGGQGKSRWDKGGGGG